MYLIYKISANFTQIPTKNILNLYQNPFISKLQSRTLIKIQGKETQKYLQGIMTNNIQILSNSNSSILSLYTIFMNPKGKVITDAFIIKPQTQKSIIKNQTNQFWLDVSKDMNDTLFSHLKKYTWKKDVQLTNLTHFHFYAIYGNPIQTDKNQIQGSYFPILDENTQTQPQTKPQNNHLSFIDPRGPQFGIRIITKQQNLNLKLPQKTQNQYKKFNTLQGSSTNNSMINKIPFMFNSDLFHGFSFNKGCYLGQELIARSYNTGIIRRRIFPYILQNSNAILQQGKSLKGENGLDIGKVLQSYPGYGTVIINYLPLLDKQWPLKIQGEIKGTVQIPFQHELSKYISDMKSKQARLQQIDL